MHGFISERNVFGVLPTGFAKKPLLHMFALSI